MSALYPVILCGGSGTRLWPSSRPDRPKQFLKLIGERSSFQDTVLRVTSMGAIEVIIVTGPSMVELVERQAAEIGADITIIIEPEARDSGPAIAAAAAYVLTRDPKGVMLMLAADHHIAEPEIFREAAMVGIHAAAEGMIVTFGVKPTSAATGFGYIKPGEMLGCGVQRVTSFVEKPDEVTAARYVEEGYYWNSGNFAFAASVLIEELQVFEPAMAAAALGSIAAARTEGGRLHLDRGFFMQAPKKSLDYAVMEHTQRATVAAAAFTWSDLGSWDAIWTSSLRDSTGNSSTGDVHLINTKGVLARSNGPFLGVIGVHDLMIIAEPDAVLICHRNDAQAVKAMVDVLKANGRDIAHQHAISYSGGVERQPLTRTKSTAVEIWRADAGVSFSLPSGTIHLLEGGLTGEAGTFATGARADLDSAVQVRAEAATTILLTRALEDAAAR
jgi:mannose-1-phosphate guanylyltransferase